MEITALQIDKVRAAMIGIVSKAVVVTSILDSLIEPPVLVPPLFKQCDYPWGLRQYSNQSGNTFCYSGCLVTAFASLTAWALKDDHYNPLVVAEVLNTNDAFVGPYLSHPSRAGYDMKWYGANEPEFWSTRYESLETSKVDYTKRPADTRMLSIILERHPVVALIDYYPRDGENDIDSHFVLVYKYIPDPNGGLNDDALIMDPMSGYTSILTYFNPEWYGQWMIDNNVSKVARTICGLRIWEPQL